MWELCICAHGADVAKYVYQNLKSQTLSLDACVTIYEQFDNFYVIFGCPVSAREKAQNAIEEIVFQVVCEFYKDVYLSENLHFPIKENLSKTAFKKALLNFDKETDCFIISKNLSLEGNLHLDSFFNFRLKALRDKWDELIELANDNYEYLTSPDAFFDLLRFLIDNLTICEDEVSIFKEESGYAVKVGSKKKDHLTQEGLVSSVIDMCPKKINFFCHGDDTVNFLSKIFDERVILCSNVEKMN